MIPVNYKTFRGTYLAGEMCGACGCPLFHDGVENRPRGAEPGEAIFVCEPCRKDAARRFSRLYAAGYLRSYWRAPTLFRMMQEWDERPHLVMPGGMDSGGFMRTARAGGLRLGD